MIFTHRRKSTDSSNSGRSDGDFPVGLVHVISNSEEREAGHLLISVKVQLVFVMRLQEDLAIFTLVFLLLSPHLFVVIVSTVYAMADGGVSGNESSWVPNPRLFLVRILIVWRSWH